jgi:hypothetical protein
MMTAEQRAVADAILADAADHKRRPKGILSRLTALGRQLGGDDRHELTQQVYHLLDNRPDRGWADGQRG